MTTEWKLPWNGGCRCDQLRIQITQPPIMTMACHCAGCQRMTASAFSLSIMVPSVGFAVTTGEPVIGGLHGASKHHHCGHCKSWVFTRPEGLDGFVNIRATMLDEHMWVRPYVEVCRDEAFPWAITGAPHSFPNIPAQGTWGPIMSEFNKTGPRP